MRPIAAPAPVPLRFPEAVVASPGQGSMQHLLRGCDLTLGPDARGRSTTRLLAPLRATEHPGAGAVAGRDCRRAADQAGSDGGALGGVSRESRTSPHAEPATAHASRWSPGWVGGGAGRRGPRPGTCPRGGVAQFANRDKDLKERRAVDLAAERAAEDAGQAPAPGDEWRVSRISTKTLWTAGAVGSAAGRAARAPARYPSPGRVARFANLDKDPTERCVVGLAAGRAGGAPTRHLPSGRLAQFVNLDKDPMERWTVGLAAEQAGGVPTGTGPPGEWRNSQISTQTHVEPVGATTAPPPAAASTSAPPPPVWPVVFQLQSL
jgi:hypothetical protein